MVGSEEAADLRSHSLGDVFFGSEGMFLIVLNVLSDVVREQDGAPLCGVQVLSYLWRKVRYRFR